MKKFMILAAATVLTALSFLSAAHADVMVWRTNVEVATGSYAGALAVYDNGTVSVYEEGDTLNGHVVTRSVIWTQYKAEDFVEAALGTDATAIRVNSFVGDSRWDPRIDDLNGNGVQDAFEPRSADGGNSAF